jgi:reactive intermediate/imine deaminase
MVRRVAVVALGAMVSVFAGGCACSSCERHAKGGAPEVSYLTSETMAGMNLPFSQAVRVGDVLYLSGQIGLTPGTRSLAPGGIGPETRQTLENIRTVLEANGSGMDRVVKCTVFLADIAEWPAMNDVYRGFFRAGRAPARSAVAGSGLALGARVEIECIAVVGEPVVR